MRKILFTFLIVAYSFTTVSAQINAEPIDFDHQAVPYDVLVKDNFLYVVDQFTVSRIDLQDPNAEFEEIIAKTFVRGIIQIDDMLYIDVLGEISRIDLSIPNAPLESVFTLPNSVAPNGFNDFVYTGGMTTDGTDLYYNEVVISSGGDQNVSSYVISKITNLDGAPERIVLDDTLIIDNDFDQEVLFPFNDLEYFDNKLYFTDAHNKAIRVIDLDDSTPNTSSIFIEGLSKEPTALAIDGDTFYISYTDQIIDTDQLIAKINVENAPDFTEQIITGAFDDHPHNDTGRDVYVLQMDLGSDNILYTASINGFFTVNVENILSVSEVVESENSIQLFPNPAESYIKLSNIKESTNYKIYSVVGQNLTGKNEDKGILNVGDNIIDIAGLSSGLYFLEINNTIVKFMKR